MKNALLVLICLAVFSSGCNRNPAVQSASGVEVAMVGKLQTDDKGHTVEQRNIMDRIQKDNDLGAVKHLYIISAYSGQVLLYSPVRGKVTSGGKRLTPSRIDGLASNNDSSVGRPAIKIGNIHYTVNELPNEDGTFGSGSADYLYWFTPAGSYHQHYLSGGQIVHISDHPIATKDVVIRIQDSK